jgi:predicted short-subunit dehydrogenase-like oxidoreductase (DUF2520 family)
MASILQSSRRGVATATVVGRGRLGRPVARALRAAGVRVNGPTGRGEAIVPADVILLCVPDAEIAAVAASLDLPGAYVGHMSGATSLADVDFGIHPLQTFVGDEGSEVFRGIGCAVAGRSPEALSVAQELARLLGTHPFVISDDQRAGYHAAASLASNLILSVLAAAEEMAATAGLAPEDARSLLAPLARSTVLNWAELGPRAALTGPIVRGDIATVQRQRDAVEVGAPELLPLFDALCTSTRTLVATGAVTA